MGHKERTLSYIRQFGSITSLDAFKYLGNTRLSATIFSLRKDGYNIIKMKEKAKNKFGETIHYDRYYLREE